MPEMTHQQRASGGQLAAGYRVRLDHDRDWTVPTDLDGLRSRPLPTPDQSRYGPPGTTDTPTYNLDGTPRRAE